MFSPLSAHFGTADPEAQLLIFSSRRELLHRYLMLLNLQRLQLHSTSNLRVALEVNQLGELDLCQLRSLVHQLFRTGLTHLTSMECKLRFDHRALSHLCVRRH